MFFKYMTAGESHGPGLTAVVDGVPAGLELGVAEINADLARRQLGHGRGGRMKIEKDEARITAGVRHGLTLGSPIALTIENRDWKNWSGVMSVAADGATRSKKVSVPRPGHADLAGAGKFGLDDMRSVLERASARETAARVAVGAIARQLLSQFGVEVYSHVVQIGRVRARKADTGTAGAFSGVDSSPVRCLDERAARDMKREIDGARKEGESVGGVFEVVVLGLEPGIGSYTSGPGRLGGRIGGALMSIPAIKGAEIGEGFRLAGKSGSKVHDEIFFSGEKGYHRRTNRAGGLEGGMTNGEPLVARACMKPIPTMTRPLRSVDAVSGKPAPAHKERSDVCAVPAAAVVGEAMVAIEVARAMMEKFGGDFLGDMLSAHQRYVERVRSSWPAG
ncbi:MAG: chorismate synthase [Gaiellales bacterium]|nr:MAG: chorismate synthase [Gaiellales bacterium]